MGSRQLATAALFMWLAAVLDPGDLGIATLAVVLPVFSLPLVLQGIRQVVIQRPEIDARTTDTAFALNLAIGFTVSAGLFIAAPLVGHVFQDDRIIPLARFSAVIPFFAGIGVLHETLLEREFRHRRIAAIHITSALFALLAAIAAVLADYPIWSLSIFGVVSYASVSILYWATATWRPQCAWSGVEARRQLRVAMPLMLSKTIATGNQRIVEMMVGALLSPAAAAFFRFGGNFINLTTRLLVGPLAQVLLPAFAASKSSPEHNIRRALAANAAVLFPVALTLAAILPDLVLVAFGEKWTTGGQIGSILCFSVFTTLIGPIANPLLVSREKGHWALILTLAALATIVILVPLGAIWGAVGASLAYVLRGVVLVPVSLIIITRAVGIPARRILSSFLPFAFGSVAMYLMLLALATHLDGLGAALRIPLLSMVGLALYVVSVRLVVKRAWPETYALIEDIVSHLCNRFMGAYSFTL